jgi:5-methylcytosine-specific restriction enzyme A
MPGGSIDPASLPKGENGRGLCRWCSLEVPKGRLTFCSDWCVHEWKLRTNPGYLRDQVFKRDRGICAICRVNCQSEILRLKKKPADRREKSWAVWGLRPYQRRSLWDADHIVPVVEGGGECDLNNIRTLCLRCHKTVTAELRLRRSTPATTVRNATEG